MKYSFGALISAFLVACFNHFGLHQPNPDLDKLVALVTVSYHAAETVVHSVEQIVALGHRWIDKEKK